MRARLIIAAACGLVSSAALAQSMNAAAFYKRAAELQALGPMAIFQRDEIDALLAEAKAATARAKARQATAVKARKPKRFCAPAEEEKMSAEEFMTRLSAIPAVQRRRIDMTEAMTRILAGKYPCKRRR